MKIKHHFTKSSDLSYTIVILNSSINEHYSKIDVSIFSVFTQRLSQAITLRVFALPNTSYIKHFATLTRTSRTSNKLYVHFKRLQIQESTSHERFRHRIWLKLNDTFQTSNYFLKQTRIKLVVLKFSYRSL